MKRLLTSSLLLWLCCVIQISRAQVPTAVDFRDDIGQRLGWSSDKIYNALKGSYYTFNTHLVADSKQETVLYYTGPHGETLTYFLTDHKAQEASLAIPAGTKDAHDMILLVSKGAKLLAFDEVKMIASYLSPYAKITIYNDNTSEKGERVCFFYSIRND